MTPAALAASRIGEILLGKGLLTKEQLDDVLAEQERTGQRFGELLLERGLVSRLALASALAEQWATLEGEHVAVAAAPDTPATDEKVEALEAIEEEWQALRAHRPIGEIFVSAGLITQEQLERALEEQRSTGQRLGEVLVAHGAVSRLELASALAEQWDDRPQLRVATDAQAPVAPPPARPATAPPIPAPETSAPAPEPDLGATPEASPAPSEPPAEAPELPAAAATPVEAGASGRDGRLEEIEGRLVLIESDRRINDLAERESTLAQTTQELEARMAELEQISSSGQDGDGRIEALAAELGELRDSIAELRSAERPPRGGVDAEELAAAVEGRIAPLDDRLTSFGRAVEELGTDLRGSVERLSERFAGETKRLEELAREASAARPATAHDDAETAHALEGRLARLEEHVAATGADTGAADELGERIEALEHNLSDVREAGNTLGTTMSSALALIRDRLEQETERLGHLVSERVEALAAEPLAAELRESSVDLSAVEARLDTLEQAAADGRLAGLVEKVASELAQLAGAVAAVDDSKNTDELQERIVRLEEQLGSLAGTASADQTEELAAQLADLRSALAAELREQEVVWNARLEAAVDQCVRLLDDAASARVREDVEALRAGQERALQEAMGTLESRLDALAEQARRPHEGIDRAEELAAELAELRGDLEERRAGDHLEERLGRIEAHVGSLDETAAARAVEQAEALREQAEALGAEQQRALGKATAALESRLDALEEQAAQGSVEADRRQELAAELAELRSGVAEVRERVSAASAQLEERTRAQIEALDAEQDRRLLEVSSALEARLEALATQSGEVSDRSERLSTGLTELRDALGRLDKRFGSGAKTLDTAVERLDELAEVQTAAHDALAATVADHVVELEARLAELGKADERFAGESQAALAELRSELDAASADAQKATAASRRQLEALRTEQEEAAREASAALDARVAGFEQAAREESAALDHRVGAAEQLAAERARTLQGQLEASLDTRARELETRLAAFDEAKARMEAELQASLDEALGRFGDRLETSERLLSTTSKQVEGWLVELGERQQAAQDALADVFEARVQELDGKIAALGEADVRTAAELRSGFESELDRIAGRLLESEETLGAAAQWLSARLDSVEERFVVAEGALGRVDDLAADVGSLSRAVDGLHGRIEGHMAAALAALAGWRATEVGRQAPLPEPAGAPEPEPEPVSEQEPEPAQDGFFAFVPSSNGYRLVKCDGTPPPVGGELELPGVPDRLLVAKLGASPLSADRRPCAYLELAPSASADEPEAEPTA